MPVKLVPVKLVPGKLVPGKLVPGKLVPGKLVPGKLIVYHFWQYKNNKLLLKKIQMTQCILMCSHLIFY